MSRGRSPMRSWRGFARAAPDDPLPTRSTGSFVTKPFDFGKYHGIGNHFIVIQRLNRPDDLPSPDLIRALCMPAFGVGADGIIIGLPAERAGADFRMRMFNPDGSEAGMCGNGIRCLAKYLYDNDYTHKTRMVIETAAGLHHIDCRPGADKRVEAVEVDMGPPRFRPEDVPIRVAGADFIEQPLAVDGRTFTASAVSMGNPHVVIFEAVSDAELHRYGPLLEHHPLFPSRTNVHFVEVGTDELRVKVWERGAGATLACGTGACAVAAVAVRTGRVDGAAPITVRLPGGPLTIRVSAGFESIRMTGPAVAVFQGRVELP